MVERQRWWAMPNLDDRIYLHDLLMKGLLCPRLELENNINPICFHCVLQQIFIEYLLYTRHSDHKAK